jgi:signal transduction histidine kinase
MKIYFHSMKLYFHRGETLFSLSENSPHSLPMQVNNRTKCASSPYLYISLHKMKPHISILIALLTLGLFATSCTSGKNRQREAETDSLNTAAYSMRYRDAKTSHRLALQAYRSAGSYGKGKAEAANTLGFCAFVIPDFREAARRYNEVYTLTTDDTERLIADVGLMKICQRRAMNKEFFDHRVSALRRLARLEKKDRDRLSPHERSRLLYARSEFYIVSAVYHYYLRQKTEALQAIRQLDTETLQADTGQLLYYHYIRASASLGGGETPEEERLHEGDEFYQTLRIAERGNYFYFHANALQGIANLLIPPAGYRFFRERRSYALSQLGAPVDTLLPLRVAEHALDDFRRYGDNYQIAGTYLSIARYLNLHSHYTAALDTLDKASACLADSVNTAPESIARIHEQYSMAYAGLGMKEESDEHRNIYLDLLDETRQDREQESRFQILQTENERLSRLTLILSLSLLTLLLVLFLLNRYGRRRQYRLLTRLRGDMEGDRNRWLAQMTDVGDRLREEHRQLEKQSYVYERHLNEGKRTNIVRKTCLAVVTGITPYIDRILHQLKHLPPAGEEARRRESFVYMDELITAVNEQNSILADWIQLKRGELQLNIENFPLQELFALIAKGSRTFEQKGLQLQVDDTPLYLKADRALTFFMINTLADNARKYTPEGGRIHISAQATAEYVEISVEDTGYGLSQEDIHRLTEQKVYNPQEIGSGTPEVKRRKGSGYGLMNCRGIIEKYRKSGDMFKVCTFGIESTLGKGSRFYFRLPPGIRKTLLLLCLLALPFGAAFGVTPADTPAQEIESREYEAPLNTASAFADSAYYSNIDRNYEAALAYADSALLYLNSHCVMYAGDALPLLSLTPDQAGNAPAEIAWWNSTYNSDFHVILDIRNEAAIAFLALHRWAAYSYNNDAYTTLYKLLGEDNTLESYCNELERSTRQRHTGIVLFGCFISALLPLYCFGYVHRRYRKRKAVRRQREAVLRLLLSIDPDRLTEEQIGEWLTKLNREPHTSIPETTEIVRRELQTLTSIYDDIEQARDNASRIRHESATLHVQNMVMDNTLSTIKHETIYYPNKIKQLIAKLLHPDTTAAQQAETINTMDELMDYYKGIFTLLSDRAFYQTDEVTFRRTLLQASELTAYAESYFKKRLRNTAPTEPAPTLDTELLSGELSFYGDRTELYFLLESLIDEALTVCRTGKLLLTAKSEEANLRFTFTDTRRTLSTDELHNLFYPQEGRDMTYLICKQVIREHDNYGVRGCRINAESFEQAGVVGGYSVYFTLPHNILSK